MKQQLSQLIEQSIQSLQQQSMIPADAKFAVQLERSKNPEHGDLACNIALALAKQAGKPPRELAASIIEQLPENSLIASCDIAGPGFINFFVAKDAATAVINEILEQQNNFGKNNLGQEQSLQIEFVSANPTGPLHVGHGRGAAIGDSMCRLLKQCGYKVTAEFYYNDAGQQISNLGLSTQSRCKGLTPESEQWPEDGYRGDYIKDVANAFTKKQSVEATDISVTASGNIDSLDDITQFAVAYLRKEQDLDLQAFDVNFDVYFLESSLYADGKVEQTVNRLIENGKTYEQDGALWLKTTDYGDDKDRVMRKKDGGYTYFLPDVAYHLDKFQRGFNRVINEQGADHHSTITRVRAGLQALNADIPEGYPEYVLHQMVTVMKNGEEVKISKRAGSYVTLRDLIDEVGRDATRYFLVSRRPDSQLTFDIDLAKSQSNENPVYYIQYAHARAASVQNKAASENMAYAKDQAKLSNLNTQEEAELLKALSAYPEAVKNAGERLEPHAIANYLKDLAAKFHSFYNAHKVLIDDSETRNARIALCLAVKQVIANGLDILGVSAPDSM